MSEEWAHLMHGQEDWVIAKVPPRAHPPDATQGGGITPTATHPTHLVTTCLPRHVFVWIRLLVFPSECEQWCRCQGLYGLEARQNQVLRKFLKSQVADHVCVRMSHAQLRASDSPSSATLDRSHLSFLQTPRTFHFSGQEPHE